MSAVDQPEPSWCTGCGDPVVVGHRYCGSCGHAVAEIPSPNARRSYKGPRRMLIAGVLGIGAGVPLAAATFVSLQASGAPETLLNVGGPILNFGLELFGEDPVTAPEGDSASVVLVLAFVAGFIASGLGAAFLVMGLLWLIGRALVGRKPPKVSVPNRGELVQQSQEVLAAGKQQAGRAVPAAERAANHVITAGANRMSGTGRREAPRITSGDPLEPPR